MDKRRNNIQILLIDDHKNPSIEGSSIHHKKSSSLNFNRRASLNVNQAQQIKGKKIKILDSSHKARRPSMLMKSPEFLTPVCSYLKVSPPWIEYDGSSDNKGSNLNENHPEIYNRKSLNLPELPIRNFNKKPGHINKSLGKNKI